MLKAKLVIVGGDAKAGEVSLQLPTTIGRGKEADLTIPHALVSRTHSKLFEREGRLWVKDLNSLNGTFVNNTRIESEQMIEPNQLLTLGNITFRAVYRTDESARTTLPSTGLPGSLQTIKIDPIVPPTQTEADATHAEPASVFEETVPPRMLEKDTPQVPLSPVNLPKKPPKMRKAPPTEATIDLGLTDPTAVAAVSSVDIDLDLPDNVEPAPISFLEKIETGDTDSPSVIEDFQIKLDSDEKPEIDVDSDRLDSFMKKLPK